ncbi:major capsid protein [Capybara microvirus Cap1_SP_151]|nr:major capsid protein [Capybara microvirus Cap1_SP_151]
MRRLMIMVSTMHASKFFTEQPNIEKPRSTFDLSHNHLTTMNAGDLVPIDVVEVLPGDTFKYTSTNLCRMMTLIAPIFDNIYCDISAFFVPNRLVWNHWINFMGENDQDFWTQKTTYSIPQITPPSGGFNVGTLGAYIYGCPGVSGNLSMNALPLRAYCKIINDWYRDENYNTPCNCPTDDVSIQGSNGSDYVIDCVKGGMPFVAAKYHDYFTSSLPSPQKGPSVELPLGDSAPVYPGQKNLDPSKYCVYPNIKTKSSPNDSKFLDSSFGFNLMGAALDGGAVCSAIGSASGSYPVYFTNLNADLSSATAATVNDLRTAFAIQKMYELDARGGSRYIEMLKNHFGVVSPDSRLQRSEFLGGTRFEININQVVQTAQSDISPLGETAAFSITSHNKHLFNKSFTEHGYIIVLACFRYLHSYAQGLHAMFSRLDRFDFYDPMFANIGEQPIKNKEIMAQGTAEDDEVFGYKGAFDEYRYIPNKVSGYMSPQVPLTLASWNLADKYNSLPIHSSSWLKEDKANVDRVIAVSSQINHQFLLDNYFKISATRVMPTFAIPGRIDHF